MSTRRVVTLVATVALLGAACTAGGGSPSGGSSSPLPPTINPSASHAPVTITLWTFFTGPELKQFKTGMKKVSDLYPWITVKIAGAKDVEDNNDIKQAINSGTPPDVVISPFPQDVARFCDSGGWIDLNPFIEQERLDLSTIIPQAALSYTAYNGIQCSLPVLSDAYGLYYNVDMLKAKGYTKPPQTISELTDMAKKLTEFNPDGSLKVVGWMPLLETFYENQAINFGHAYGAQWYDSSGTKSALASDPAWGKMLTWQKSLVDWYGYDKLQRFFADLGGPDSEWSPAHAFETGKVAMNTDGEWRVAFIHDYDQVDINYGTAPFPVADDQSQLYGSGQIGGNTAGIPKGSEHPAEAWLVLKYLATDTQIMVLMANLLKNVPTTFDALADPGLASDPHFATFLQIFQNPNSSYKQITPIGDEDQTLFKNFISKWQAGKATDLQGGLEDVAQQIDQEAALG
jgi:multiple sugar transport system substrate-binding protein